MAEQEGPRPSSQSRFARRRLLGRVARYRRHIAVVLGLGMLAGAVWVVYFSSILGVRDVEVDGTRLLSAQQVTDAAAVPSGQALARLDTGAIEDRVRALAPVAGVTVSRVWPRGVEIVVREREAVAAVWQGDRVSGMDADGVLFRTYAEPPRRLPVVDAGELEGIGQAEALHEAAAAVAALAPEIARQVAVVEVVSRDGITLVLSDDDRVTWGSARDSDLKAEVLAALLEQPASVYDVSVPAQPTTLQ